MPHLSSKKVSQHILSEIELVLDSFLVESSPRMRKQIFRTLFTRTERLMIGKRLTLLYLLKEKMSHYRIARVLGMSETTVGRFALKVERGDYDRVLPSVRRSTRFGRVLNALAKYAVFAADPKKRSLGTFLDSHN